MKSKEFITENKITYSDEELRIFREFKIPPNLIETVYHIKQKCQPFLNEIEDPFSLLRGLRHTDKWAVTRPVRLDDRRPMSTPQWLHNELNVEFKKRFGAEFRNAMFCTGDVGQAKVYGVPFAIFPIGEYKYLWSTEYRDLYQNFDNYRFSNRANNERDFVKHMNFDSYRTNGLNDAIDKGHEIMVRTYSYFGLNMSNIWKDKNSGPIQNGIQEYLIQ